MKARSIFHIILASCCLLSTHQSVMAQGLRRWCWRFGLIGALTMSTFLGDRTLAQSNIVADDTLGAETSLVIQNFNGLPIELITGGTARGQNLFHSFVEFNVSEGRGAYFSSPADIQNILARVTGSNRSEILGTLGTLGNSTPNLFLINPNGIIFGRNASLDVGGSFVATTANAIGFGNLGFFSASTPSAPSPLLTINPSVFWFNQFPAGNIVSNSITPVQPGSDRLGLQVPNGETLILLGGNVRIDGGGVEGGLHTLGGRVEIGAVAGTGTVGLNADGSLNFPEETRRADVSLTNSAGIDVRSLGRDGDIAITAQNIDILGASLLLAGILPGFGSLDSQAGDIILSALDAIRVDRSSILNAVSSNATGNAGDIQITTSSLSATNNTQLIAGTFGRGNAGSVIISATDYVSLDTRSDFFSTVEEGAVGRGGDVRITTGSLSITNGAGLLADTLGQGDAGDVIITATNHVSFDGGDRDADASSGVFSAVNPKAVGRGGDIYITTDSLSVTNGAQLMSSTLGQGDAGNIIITATNDVLFDGRIDLSNSFVPSSAFTEVREGRGQGGDMYITARSLRVTNGAFLQSATHAQGNAGNIIITATDRVLFDNGSAAVSAVYQGGIGWGGDIRITTGSLSVTNGAQLNAGTAGQGNSGNIIITATDRVLFDGTTRDGIFSSAAFSDVSSGSVGQGGDIRITTGSLSVNNGALLDSSTSGQGDAGDVVITATDRVSFDNDSGAYSSVAQEAIGQGGDIRITTGSLSLNNGAQLAASTTGQGNAGNIIIDAAIAAFLEGVGNHGHSSGMFTITEEGAGGQGGTIIIDTPSLSIANGAVVNARTANSRRGGDIIIQADTLEAVNGGQIITTALSRGQAGNITLNISDRITLSGRDPTFKQRLLQFGDDVNANEGRGESGLFANTRSNATGQGGSIRIATEQLTIRDEAQIAVNSQGTGGAGNITITANSMRLDRGKLTAETGASGDQEGAIITLRDLDLLLLSNGSQISARAFGEAKGGNVTIEAADGFLVAIPRGDSDIIASAARGRGGEIQITAQGIFDLKERRAILGNGTNDIDASSEFGVAGTVTLNTPDVDPSRGLAALPTNVIDPSQEVAQSCTPRGEQASRFVATGRGGLPLSPDEPLRGRAVVPLGWVTLDGEAQTSAHGRQVRGDNQMDAVSSSPTEIVEANGWVVDAKGNVVLVAHFQIPNPVQSPIAPVSCPN